MLSLKEDKGFTLIEVLVVMVLFILVSGFALFLSLDSFRGYVYASDRNTLVSALQKARSQALANVNQKPHGVHINHSSNPKTYTVFEGSSWTDPSHDPSLDIRFEVNKNVVLTGVNDVIFSPLSGETGNNYTLALQDASRPYINNFININYEGRIDLQ